MTIAASAGECRSATAATCAGIGHAPLDQGYGLRELRVRDRDGHVPAFGKASHPAADQDAWTR